jgi:hypothetical protein
MPASIAQESQMSETLLEFHPLTFVTERDGIVVGRPDTESYALLPEDGADLLRRLADGLPAEEAANWYHDTFHEDVDMLDFITEMRDLGFIVSDADRSAIAAPLAQPVTPKQQRLGRAFFSWPAWAAFAVIAATGFLVQAWYPALQPSSGSLFFTQSIVISQVALLLAQIPVTAWHEWFHVLAARRIGVPSRLGVSRRLIFMVVETRMSGLLSVPPRKRYLPILAGIVADVVLYGALNIFAALTVHHGVLPWPGRLAVAVAITVQVRVVWQLFMFVRTDPYYALSTRLGTTDLSGASRRWLRNLVRTRRRAAASAEYKARWSPRDRRHAPWFGLGSVFGVIILFAIVGHDIFIPIMMDFGGRVASELTSGTAGPRFWDSVLLLAFWLVWFCVLPVVSRSIERRSLRKEQSLAIDQ